MKKTAIITDSNSGISPEVAKEMGIFVLPMPFMIDNNEYFEWVNLNATDFFEKLKNDSDISTSQPTPDSITNLWDEVLEEYDEIVHIPMSSSLSGACQTAYMLSNEYDGKVQIVDNKRISVTMKQSVRDAVKLASDGKSAEEIKNILEEHQTNNSIYIMLDTLKYLKKGGRLTPAVATLGSILRIKPVLQIQGGKLDTYSIARTPNIGRKVLIDAVKKDLETRFAELNNVKLSIAHTNNTEAAAAFAEEVKKAFPDYEIVDNDELSLSVSCHIGPGALALTCFECLD